MTRLFSAIGSEIFPNGPRLSVLGQDMDQLVDKLRSQQETLSLWLSTDPDLILDKWGDILSVNDHKEVTKHEDAAQKIRELLKIIIKKKKETCFIKILMNNLEHFRPLQNFFFADSPHPTTFADDNSVVSSRVITDTSAKSFLFNVEIEGKPGRERSGNVTADYTAQGMSVSCTDKLHRVTADGDINFSVTLKPSHSAAGNPADVSSRITEPHSSGYRQDQAVKTITEHKVQLIQFLMSDHIHILQHVHQNHIVTDRQYQDLKSYSRPGEAVTNLIDLVIGKGPDTSAKFLQVLKDHEVVSTYPQLKDILNTDDQL